MRFLDTYAAPYASCTWVPFPLLEAFVPDVLAAAGVPEPDAAVVADVLLESDRRGIDSHGIGRLKPIYIDRIRDGILDPVTRVEVLREGRSTAVLDGHNGMGHVVARTAMEMAITKAKAHGLGMVAVRNSTHYGIAGYYAGMAAAADCIGMTGTNARPSVAPTHGVSPMLGTNPLTVALPTDEAFPFCLDAATSITQRGAVEQYARMGWPLPEGWVVDADGKPCLDAQEALRDLTSGRAALAPLGGLGEVLGGHKGYGLATFVEILCAALQDGASLLRLSGLDAEGHKAPYPLGHFFLAIDVSEFIEPARFRALAGGILRELRASPKAPGAEAIFTPGEKEHLVREYRRVHGCPVSPALRRDLETLRAWYGLPHRFPWD